MTLHVVVLAHAHPEALAEQVEDLRLVNPGCTVSVFNGGRDQELTRGLDVEVVPYSRPLRHGHLGLFHGLTMQWLAERRQDFGHLVTLDSDAVVVRPLAPAGDYLAPHLAEVRPGTPWSPGRRLLPAWPQWQPLFGIPFPLRCFNPVQVFSRTYVERFLDFPGRGELMDRLATTRLAAMEEVVWPSLAVTLGCTPQAFSGDTALRLSRHTPLELRAHLADPEVHVVHKVGLEPGATDRRLVREHLRGGAPDFGVPCDYPAGERPPSRLTRVKDLVHRMQQRR